MSTDQQADSGLSIEAQREQLVSFTIASGLELVGLFIDAGISGAKDDCACYSLALIRLDALYHLGLAPVKVMAATKKRSAKEREGRRSALSDADYQHVIDILIEARTEAKVSQSEIARRLGRPQSYIAKIEHAKRRADLAEFVRICEAIGADPHELLDRLRRRLRKKLH